MELRGQKSAKNRYLERARKRLKKAKDAGYKTVTEHCEKDDALRVKLWADHGITAGEAKSTQVYKMWLAKQDRLGPIPPKERTRSTYWREERFQGTDIVSTFQGGDKTDYTCRASLHPDH